MGTAQLKNRMEGPGRRQLTGEPTFLTQVPKESDANTPSALSITFIILSTSCAATLRGGELSWDNGLCMFSSWVHFGAGIRALFLEGSSHSPAFANIHRELVVATYSRQQVCVLPFFSLPHSLQLGLELGLEMHF